MMVDVDNLPNPDPLTRRVDGLETGLSQFKTEITQKVDGLGHKIDTALAEKNPIMSVFSDGCRASEPPKKGQTIWFTFRHTSVELWVPCKGCITGMMDQRFDDTTVPTTIVYGVHNNIAASADIAENV